MLGGQFKQQFTDLMVINQTAKEKTKDFLLKEIRNHYSPRNIFVTLFNPDKKTHWLCFRYEDKKHWQLDLRTGETRAIAGDCLNELVECNKNKDVQEFYKLYQ